METLAPVFSTNLFGIPINITIDIIVQWIIIILLSIASIYYTGNLKLIPNKRQSKIEILVDTVNNLVKENMGEDYKNFVPYIGTLMIFLLTMNLSGLFGVEPPTKDYNIALSLGLITFMVIQGNIIKKHGLLEYFLGLSRPFPVMTPLNIIERVMLPISLSLRLFGNMMAASVLVGLVYDGLGKVGYIAEIGIPIPVHFYFDIFDGAVQMIIFSMLTMINIKVISEH